MEIKVHINEIKGKNCGFRNQMEQKWQTQRNVSKEYKDALALQASIREELISFQRTRCIQQHLLKIPRTSARIMT